ncbi:TPA: two-component system sensor histidine kinase QseC [Pasteurella multocida]|uniref:quorum sensing histidine kinase QseC n=1 Tax=Pasteurella multocida TaxID=747 RepID=UPI0007EDCA52|nr:quorum sensing histidine kinase QseC [Pasteurella multocida]MCL7789217.1 two-component system sensor histidine kinase QseC [Pasteurella multocida]MCL7797112.1 two-component system sensor histidine kinase QseC [Pasteurella multocida]OBP31954.1 two-component sensor histidine kinase [Pasteurella multocida subsp. multocida]PNM07505.1 two-component system sensor histidine kinase QseC [Pasteurella multocida]QHZ98673.1 two-component system sensor histidine kinase QseC [Pasteurella multocida]
MKWLKQTSLRVRLIFTLSLTALVIWLASTAVAWFQVRKEVNDVFDAQQILLAQRLASANLHNMLIARAPHDVNKQLKKVRHYDDDALAFAIFNHRGDLLLSDGNNGENFIFAPHSGFSVSAIREDDDRWRIFWLPVNQGKWIIAVGQEMDYREDLINQMVFGQMWIWFASLPFLLGILVWVISRELRPLKQVNAQLMQRRPDDTSLLPSENLPTEILPLIHNLNHFFERTATMLLRERRFTSDAAHELRSPLAALRIQTEVAQMAGDDALMREQALQNLTLGIDRASQLIERLLTLSRLDNLAELDEMEAIHWEPLIASLVSELYFSAQKRQMDLQFELIAAPPVQQGQPLLLSLMLRNLIDNALRYCPEGSTITIKLYADRIVIEDNGNGVNDADLAKLGQRFYRPAGQNEKGSGLGLSIVQRIATLHHYQFRLENVKDDKGYVKGFRSLILLNKI